MRQAALRLVRNLDDILHGRRFSSPSITYKDEAAFLAMPPGPPTIQTHWGPAYLEESGTEYSGEALVCSDDDHIEVSLEKVQIFLPRIQRLSQEEFLVVDIRGWKPGFVNAHVYAVDGRLLRSFHLPGAEEVLTEPDGRIWSTFDDESASSAQGSSALIQVDIQGRKQWGFNENRGAAESVWMFYALNVGRGVVWACGYTEFELVRIKQNQVTAWSQKIGPIDEIAVSDPHILMLGAYHKGDPNFSLGRIGQVEIEDVERVRLTLPDGRTLADLGSPPFKRKQDEPFRVIGRHGALHVFAERCWYRVTVEDVMGA